MYEEGHFTPVSAAAAAPIAELPAPAPPLPPVDLPALPVPPADLPALTVPPADLPAASIAAPQPPAWPPSSEHRPAADRPGPTIAVWQLLLIVIGALAALVAGVEVLTSGGAAAASPLKVPIELRGWPGGPHGVMPIVRVRIGDGPPVPLMLDTGSTGINILAKDLPAQSHVIPTAPFAELWGGGSVSQAQIGTATVSIAGVSTTRKMTIGIVQSVKCRPGVRHCMQWVEHGAVGILGIRQDPRFTLTNPLASLPRPYSRSWSIGLSSAGGTLELGAPIPARPAASFPVTGVATPAPTEASLAGASGTLGDLTGLPTVCWQLGHRAARTCVPTMFDTGSTDTMLFSSTGSLPIHLLPTGSAVTAWSSATATTPLWSFRSGFANSENLVLTDDHRLALMDTGIAPFYAFRVTYDNDHGEMYLTPGAGIDGASLWRRSADALCTSYGAKDLAAFKAGPQVGPTATLAQRERAAAYRLRALAKLSLKGDDQWARLDVPRALRPMMARALRADRIASRMAFPFIRTIPRYRTLGALERALTRFQREEKRADADWERMLTRLKIAGCS